MDRDYKETMIVGEALIIHTLIDHLDRAKLIAKKDVVEHIEQLASLLKDEILKNYLEMRVKCLRGRPKPNLTLIPGGAPPKKPKE